MSQDSTPIPLAHVLVIADDGGERVVLTDSTGSYLAILPRRGEAYELRVKAFGFLPLSLVLHVPHGTTRIDRDLRLNPFPVILKKTDVVAASVRREKPDPGERSAHWLSFLSEKFPSKLGDFTDIAVLQPGVARSGYQGTAVSIAGQSPDQNRITLDGATYGGASLPAEGIRSVGVITDSYDVSRGGFSGGQIASTTIGGTNIWGGAFSMRVDDSALQYGKAGRENHGLSLSSGGGGPLVADHLFVYTAFDVSYERSPGSRADLWNPEISESAQIAPDSARRFLEILQRLGLYSSRQGRPESQSMTASLLGRVDYMLSHNQVLTARLDWRRSTFSGLGLSPLTIIDGEGKLRVQDGGALFQLTSAWSGWANDLRAYRSAGKEAGDAGQSLPTAQVGVTSSLSDGTSAPVVLGFGGSPFVSENPHSLWEFSDELVREIRGGAHRLKTGFLLQEQRASVTAGSNRFGTFAFNSLADLERGRAASFTRNVIPQASVSRLYGATYLGDTWRSTERLRVAYGIRLETTRYSAGFPPSHVDSIVNQRQTQPPSELMLSPRFGFRYDAPGSREWTIDGGIGRFASAHSIQSLAFLSGQTLAGSGLRCVGPATPVPHWSSYLVDAGQIPLACSDGNSIFSGGGPSITSFDSKFGVPRSLRASFGVSSKLTPRFGAELTGIVVRTVRLPTVVDLNRSASPKFRLAEESDRPVYAGPGEIDPSSGGIAPKASREQQTLGTVREVSSRGRSLTTQVSGGVSAFGGLGLLSLYYTFTRSRALVSGLPALGTLAVSTGGDPAVLEWEDVSFAPRHLFQVTASGHAGSRVRIGAVASLSSGILFTPMVRGDINGDGFENDRAFVFDATMGGDSALASSLIELQAAAPRHIRQCLRTQSGRIAAPNSCRSSWSPSIDIRADVLAIGNINSRRFIVSLTASNVTAGLDHLLHGSRSLHGWGQYPMPDATLLAVSGFDTNRRSFNYRVNPRFGEQLGGVFSRLPFRVSLQARWTLGSDPRYQPLLGAIEAGRGDSPQRIRARLAELIRNVPSDVLLIAASDTATLELTLLQKAKLQELASSLAPKFELAIDSMLTSLGQMGPIAAGRRARLQQQTQHAVSLVEAAIEGTRQILLPGQWAKLPYWLIKPPSEGQLQRPSVKVSIPGIAP